MQYATERVERPGESQEALDGKKPCKQEASTKTQKQTKTKTPKSKQHQPDTRTKTSTAQADL